MGLDMYLNRKHYVGNNYRDVSKQVKIVMPENQEGVTFPIGDIDQAKVTEITEQAIYWRKANAIHKWFVDNVQEGNDDCREYYVTRKQLEELRSTVCTVLEASPLVPGEVQNGSNQNGPIIQEGKVIEDPTVAKKLLPCTSGFFFGGTGYDQWYYQDLIHTRDSITEVLSKPGGNFYYNSSW